MSGAKLDGCHMGLPYGYRIVAHMAPIWVSYDNATGGITDGGGSLFQTCGPATANDMSPSDVVVQFRSWEHNTACQVLDVFTLFFLLCRI